jgi:hypothetical protein
MSCMNYMVLLESCLDESLVIFRGIENFHPYCCVFFRRVNVLFTPTQPYKGD